MDFMHKDAMFHLLAFH